MCSRSPCQSSSLRIIYLVCLLFIKENLFNFMVVITLCSVTYCFDCKIAKPIYHFRNHVLTKSCIYVDESFCCRSAAICNGVDFDNEDMMCCNGAITPRPPSPCVDKQYHKCCGQVGVYESRATAMPKLLVHVQRATAVGTIEMAWKK